MAKRLVAAICALSLLCFGVSAVEFPDVDATKWYAVDVSYCAENGLIDSMPDGSFAPETAASRATIVEALYRADGEQTVSEPPAFSDVPESAWYAAAANWAKFNGFVGGYGDGRFGPDDPLTREQLVAILWRMAGRPISNGDSKAFVDEAEISAYAKRAMYWAAEKGIVTGKDGNRADPHGQTSRAELAAFLHRFLTLENSTSMNVTRVNISFDFNRQSTSASNQVAVWIEDADGQVVKTLLATNFTAARRGYRNRDMSLAVWVKAVNPENMSDAEIDAVSGATPSSGTRSYSWDMTDASGDHVPDGIYTVKVEGTLYWGSNVLYTAQINTADTMGQEEKPVSMERSEPENKQNEAMLENVRVSVISER